MPGVRFSSLRAALRDLMFGAREFPDFGLDMSEAARMARADELFPYSGYRALRNLQGPSPIELRRKQWIGDDLDIVHSYLNSAWTPHSNPLETDFNEGAIVPVRFRLDNPLYVDARGEPYNNISDAGLPHHIRGQFEQTTRRYGLNTEQIARAAEHSGYDGVRFHNVRDRIVNNTDAVPPSTVSVVFPPENQRSIWAAFDPRRIKDADFFAVLPLLAALRAAMDEDAESSTL